MAEGQSAASTNCGCGKKLADLAKAVDRKASDIVFGHQGRWAIEETIAMIEAVMKPKDGDTSGFLFDLGECGVISSGALKNLKQILQNIKDGTRDNAIGKAVTVWGVYDGMMSMVMELQEAAIKQYQEACNLVG